MQRKEKEAFVKRLSKDLEQSKTVAVMPLANVPDRLLQKVRNQLRGEAKIVVAKKTLVKLALGEKLGKLADYLNGNAAIILSNYDPIDLYSKVSANVLMLSAKPGQIAPNDIEVKAGETDIAPGQAVTELKTAGIDVQIQKNKVVIAKDKKLVEAGKRISPSVANALKLLNIKPFSVSTSLSVAYSENLLFSKQALSINQDFVTKEIERIFAEANSLSIGIGYITQYNASYFISKAYAEAMALGIAAKVPEPEIIEKLVAQAAAEANNINLLAQNNTEQAGAKDQGQGQGQSQDQNQSS